MELILSSQALPSAAVDDLRRGAAQRDLEGIEVAVGTGHSETNGSDLARVLSGDEPVLTTGSPPIQWVHPRDKASVAEVLYWSRQAHLVGAGLVLQQAPLNDPLCVPLALQHPTDATAAHRAAAWARMHDAQTAWEVRLGATTTAAFEAVLEATAPTLAHVRLRGAGPEAESGSDAGIGIGTVLKELTLRGYTGTVALAPSGRGREAEWRDWLFDERGWGCNTVATKTAAR